jgi:hypothetical protein
MSRLEPPRAFALRLLSIAVLAVAAVAWLFSRPVLPQSLDYHNFADQRTLLGLPHALNVLSNLPFLFVGVQGLRFLFRRDTLRVDGPFLTAAERRPYVLFFAGVGLTAFGSAYYHLEPSNDRLLGDRLPMTVAFMGLFAAVLMERVSLKAGLDLLGPLVAVGLASALYWHWTEQQGRGDLRFYYVVQFLPMLTLPLLLLLFPPRYTRTLDLVVALGWYVLAKGCEHPLDGPIYGWSGWVSGHTLKHLAAALAAYWILRMLRARRPVSACGPSAGCVS